VAYFICALFQRLKLAQKRWIMCTITLRRRCSTAAGRPLKKGLLDELEALEEDLRRAVLALTSRGLMKSLIKPLSNHWGMRSSLRTMRVNLITRLYAWL